jgi:pyridoxal phosphate enzyme (YggS family)
MTLANIQEKLQDTTLIAVSKTKPIEQILTLYNQGIRRFGENKVQELIEKHNSLPNDIEWHMIGHLQSNKVKQLVPFVHLIHSIDSLKLLLEVQKEAKKIDRKINVLLQLYIASEETKFGLSILEATEIMEYYIDSNSSLTHINICGVMGMASNTNDEEIVKKEFTSLKSSFDFLKNSYLPFDESFKEVSMGMSSDYELAIACGSTMVRIGSLLFGNRY